MELKNISRPSESSHIEVEPVDTEKFIFDKANNEEKILLGLFFIALSLRLGQFAECLSKIK